MANTKNTPPRPPDTSTPFRIEVDYERYAPLLDCPDLSDAQKREFLQALWSIIIGFVDLGFEVAPACGQVAENPGIPSFTEPNALYSKHRNLIEQFIAADQTKEAAE